jgi:hypothetical protein
MDIIDQNIIKQDLIRGVKSAISNNKELDINKLEYYRINLAFDSRYTFKLILKKPLLVVKYRGYLLTVNIGNNKFHIEET